MENPEASKQNDNIDPIIYPTVTSVEITDCPPSKAKIKLTCSTNVTSPFPYSVGLEFTAFNIQKLVGSHAISGKTITFTETNKARFNYNNITKIDVFFNTHKESRINFTNTMSNSRSHSGTPC